MASTHGEKLLAAEWLGVVALLTGDALGQSSGGSKITLPQPSRYFASMVVYLMLAALAAAGEKTARLAGALGGVALLTIALAPSDITKPPGPGNRPLVIRFLAWLSAVMSKSNNPTGSIIATGGAGTTGGLPGGAGEATLALQQATKDMQAICSAYPNSTACNAAKQRVQNIQSVAQGASQ